VLKSKNINTLKSERQLCFPNVNSMMKLSLGLIFFTVLSTALVYGQTSSENILTIDIVENAHLHSNGMYFNNPMISVDTGSSILIQNNDVVSHKFISGSSNHNSVGTSPNYDVYLICELGEEVKPDVAKGGGFDDICDFTKDNRINTIDILPGESLSLSMNDVGTYRIIDFDYPWMEIIVYSFPKTQTESIDDKSVSNESVTLPTSPISKSIQNISVNVNGVFFNVPYTATGMTISKIESDIESMSLIFSVIVTDSTGKLNVQFDRIFFDSIYNGVDDSFFVLSDGDETLSRETKTNSQSRTLSIDVPSGTEELEVIGSIFDSSKVIETPVIETPVIETPVIETPVIETPVIETPVIETPVIETLPANQCGPGTVLEGDACVLDQRCGPGTVLEGDVCILDSTTPSSTTPSSTSPSSGISKELITSFTVAFVIAGIIGIILALISKANKN